MHKITAKKIFDGNGNIWENTLLTLDQDGTILSIDRLSDADTDVQNLQGFICPGFVNTHCHLELSHMKGKVDTGTGLIPFIKNVVTKRDADPEDIQEAIRQADAEMYENGIVAVGDISNKKDTQQVKYQSQIAYYTFVEMFDFMQESLAESTFQQYNDVYQYFEENHLNKKSIVPHAPYSVSDSLYKRIHEHNTGLKTISIHNEETPDEISLFLDKSGGFPEFFGGFGFPMDDFTPTGKMPLFHAIQRLDPVHRTLFVHNTLTTVEGIIAAHHWSDKVYWTTCANANLYIENRLPDYRLFLDQQAKMTIGTDSLTSNWQLSVWEEIKTIHKYASYVPFPELIVWATKNGAEALGYENIFGTIEVGKKPGLVALENITESDGRYYLENATAERVNLFRV